MAEILIDSVQAIEARLEQGQCEPIVLNDKKYLLYRLSDGLFVTSHQCTHLFKSLEKGVIVSDKTIRCPLHRAEFDIRTGEVDTWACFPKGIVNVINAVRTEKPLESLLVSQREGNCYVTFD